MGQCQKFLHAPKNRGGLNGLRFTTNGGNQGFASNLKDSPLKNIDSSLSPNGGKTPDPQGLYKGGGDSGGGGSGVYINDQFRLKDFALCPGLRSTRTGVKLQNEKLGPSISKISAASIQKAIRQTARVSNSLLERIIWAAAARTNWYKVKATLNLDMDIENKIAVFIRPLGVLIDERLISNLSELDQEGLFFHESLRMVSIGFRFYLSNTAIEEITCSAFSDKAIDVDRYPALAQFIKSISGEGSKEVQQVRQQTWETTLQTISELPDHAVKSFGGVNTFYYQQGSSKFETLRLAAPFLDSDQLENSFFSWAAKEVSQACYSKSECDYFEEWPTLSKPSPSLRKWNLLMNDSHYMIWEESTTGFQFAATKNEFPAQHAVQICSQIGKSINASYSVINRESLSLLENYREASFILNRDDLTSMEDDELPFLAKTDVGNLLWVPRPDLPEGFSVVNEAWNASGRILCMSESAIKTLKNKK